jgi:hypothetical protein
MQETVGHIPGMPSKRQKTVATGATFSVRFRRDLDRAANKAKPAHFMAHQLCPGSEQVKALFGADFMALLPNDSSPCIRHFIFGNCSDGVCTMRHTDSLSSLPSTTILNGITKRVKNRVDHFVQYPKG